MSATNQAAMKEKYIRIDKVSLDNCDFSKTILMLMVILQHSLNFWNKGWFIYEPQNKSVILSNISSFLSTIHVCTFTIISGYIFCYKMMNGDYKNIKIFVTKKIKRLLVPLLFVSVVWAIPIGYLFYKWDISTIFHKFILCESPSQLWFLLMLFEVSILARFTWRILKKNDIYSWAMVFSLWLIGKAGHGFSPNYYVIWTSCEYFLYFYLGITLRQKDYMTTFMFRYLLVWPILCLAFFCLANIVKQSTGLISKLSMMPINLLLTITAGISAFRLLTVIGNRINWHNKHFNNLSRHSMPMYLFHQQIVYFLIVMFDGINPYLHALLIFVFVVIISYFISYICMKNKITRILIGVNG